MSAEIYIPGSEGVHGLTPLQLPGSDDRNRRAELLVPVDPRMQLERLELFESTVVEAGLEGLERGVNPITDEYEFVAPEGFEFVIRGMTDMWSRGSAYFSPPIPSEQSWNEDEHGGGFMDDEVVPFGDEFRGRRLGIELSSNTFNPRQVGVGDDYVNHFERRPERQINASFSVKGELSVEWTAVIDQVLPFNLEGRPTAITIPRNVLTHEWVEVEGKASEVVVTIEPVEHRSQMLQIGVNFDIWADPQDELWLPHDGRGSMKEAIERDEPMMRYKIDRVGGDIENLYAYYRRMGSPYSDDPLWRAKDLRTYADNDHMFDVFIAEEIARMPKGNEDREEAEKLFLLAVGSLALVEEASADDDDEEDRF